MEPGGNVQIVQVQYLVKMHRNVDSVRLVPNNVKTIKCRPVRQEAGIQALPVLRRIMVLPFAGMVRVILNVTLGILKRMAVVMRKSVKRGIRDVRMGLAILAKCSNVQITSGWMFPMGRAAMFRAMQQVLVVVRV